MSFFEKLMKIDRRIIFLLIFVGVAIPLIVALNFELEITQPVRKVHGLVEDADDGAYILLSFDYGPSTKPEIQPMAIAILKHAFERDYKVVCSALWPMGVLMCSEAIESVKEEYPNIEYGVDYVNLGYKAGGLVTINHMGKNMRETFPTDAANNPISEISIMDNIKNLTNFDFIVGFSSGSPGLKEWVQVAHDAYGVPVAGGSTAVQVPSLSPYLNRENQLVGLLGGLKGAAEYEKLIASPGTAVKGMDAQSIAHLLIIIFITIGNIGYFVTGKYKQKRL